MRNVSRPDNGPNAFTLIEMLVVIAIIGILAALILVALPIAKINAQRKLCQAEENNLVAAVSAYFATYGRLPASTNAVVAVAGTTNDFTFGTSLTAVTGQLSGLPNELSSGQPINIVTPNSTYQNNNSEIIAILRDNGYFPETNSSGQGHLYNPQQITFYPGRNASGPATIGTGPGSHGIGVDDVLRDPWGLPYMVTLDLSGDNRVFDPYLNQMYQKQYPGGTLFTPGQMVVWSLGPTGKINLGLGLQNTVNKHLVTSF